MKPIGVAISALASGRRIPGHLLWSGLGGAVLIWIVLIGSVLMGGCSDRPRPRGEVWARAGAAGGYVLFSPLLSSTTYLIDKEGRVVHTWASDLPPAISVYLLDNGSLLRSAKKPGTRLFDGGWSGGGLQRLSWDGEVLWSWSLDSGQRLQHHDVEPLPGGNLLLVAWSAKSHEEALAAGRDPERVGPSGLWSDCVLEVRPVRPEGAEIVWEWCLWDHLAQDRDPALANFDDLAARPERVDINGDRQPRRIAEELLRKLRALGYVTGSGPADHDPDFLHTNAVDYHPERDQVLLTVPRFHEIWILDHSTTTAEAAGSQGGRSGRGGDLLYRWGSPRAYGRGDDRDQRLFAQHDGRWIPEGLPGAGNLTIFNNGARWSAQPYSSVIEIDPPVTADGSYSLDPVESFGPERAKWSYRAAIPRSFFAAFISGAQRLANGNTFVTAGPEGRLFEVSAKGRTVWEYRNPYSGYAPNRGGNPPYFLFRATHLPADHPALVGRALRPLDPQPPHIGPESG